MEHRTVLLVGEGAAEVRDRFEPGHADALLAASDAGAVREALAAARPRGAVLLFGYGDTLALTRIVRDVLPAELPTVALVDTPAGCGGALELGPEAVITRRDGESVAECARRAVEACRAFAGLSRRATVEPRPSLLQQSHQRLLARVVDAQLGQAMIVHDLRSPLGVLRGIQAELVTSSDAARYAPVMERSLDRIERLVNRLEDLHAVSRPQPRERLDLVWLVRDLVSQLQHAPENGDKELRVIADGGGRWLGPRFSVERAIANLLSNALRHARRQVDVRVEGRHGAVRITVIDDGPGIREELRDELFERYVRDPEKGRLGLGLAIVRSAADRMGGQVSAFNLAELNGDDRPGACFVLRLPRR
ncbi:MAG TPA: HAMP domain-containing sensor histidine kinase [Sandaracinaceae bacterium LLY-WYZ-13_1]|nr:HAMP domain-containing sensor histidine kinase [Sandaracinaceae bacterium LLY-WYZ-13_1]